MEDLGLGLIGFLEWVLYKATLGWRIPSNIVGDPIQGFWKI